MKRYVELAKSAQARLNCIDTKNTDWQERHEERIEKIIASLPHGSGIDGETKFDYKWSDGERIRIHSEYHYMNENGMYDGWINFTVTVLPSLSFGSRVTVTGNFGKHQDIKDYLQYVFGYALTEEVNK